ncbi:hypothetical protein Tco_0516765 [Tanacetum coccineum]
MACLPECAESQDDAGSSDWSDMFIFYCRRSAAEDREFARRINMLRGELSVACQEMVYLIQELETVKRVIAPMKMTEFLNQVKLKDDQRLAQLENLERETELRAFEKELFVQKLMSGGGGVVIDLAMVVEMVETQHLAFLTTSLQSGRKVCAYGLKQVMVATAMSSSMIALK